LFCNEIKVFSLYVKFLHIFAINHFIQMLAKITPLIQLLRPKHWIKNVLLFAPLIFSGSLLKPKAILHAALGFLYFSIAASLVYTINDLADVERDRLHPVKRLKRPLASGAVSKQTAVGIIALFSLLSLTSVLFSLAFAWVLLGYLR
jgi:4-hydroxybenzoate polyprenyltransferase and related prenyltransferases